MQVRTRPEEEKIEHNEKVEEPRKAKNNQEGVTFEELGELKYFKVQHETFQSLNYSLDSS